MYRPIQIPHVLSKEYAKYVFHREMEIELPNLRGFAIYAFEAYSKTKEPILLTETILMQGTIDIGFDLDNRWIGFGGIKRTDYEFNWSFPFRNFGIRLKPGAFHQLTGIPASSIIDDFIPLAKIDVKFDEEAFFQLSFEEAKLFLMNYKEELCRHKIPDQYTTLFDDLADDPPTNTGKLYDRVGLSSRQCQRVFAKHYGFSPKMVLTILRFQKCLDLLINAEIRTNDMIGELDYYDQAHFTNDFKRALGLTPRELVELYR